MGIAFGIFLVWIGSACLWVAVHGTDAATPWGAYQEVIKGIRRGAGS